MNTTWSIRIISHNALCKNASLSPLGGTTCIVSHPNQSDTAVSVRNPCTLYNSEYLVFGLKLNTSGKEKYKNSRRMLNRTILTAGSVAYVFTPQGAVPIADYLRCSQSVIKHRGIFYLGCYMHPRMLKHVYITKVNDYSEGNKKINFCMGAIQWASRQRPKGIKVRASVKFLPMISSHLTQQLWKDLKKNMPGVYDVHLDLLTLTKCHIYKEGASSLLIDGIGECVCN